MSALILASYPFSIILWASAMKKAWDYFLMPEMLTTFPLYFFAGIVVITHMIKFGLSREELNQGERLFVLWAYPLYIHLVIYVVYALLIGVWK